MLLNDLKFIYVYFIKFINANFQNRFTFHVYMHVFKVGFQSKQKKE